MKTWKIAVLEDNKALLKDLVELVNSIDSFKVVVHSCDSTSFIEKVNLENPDFLLLDIELVNDSMTGLDVAKKLQQPCIFVSGKNAENLRSIESLKFDQSIRIDFISKPYNDENLKKIVTKFALDLSRENKSTFLQLKFDGDYHQIPVNSIVCIGTDKNQNAESNNKVFYFNDRPPKMVADFSFKTKIDDVHPSFITIHKSFRVNLDASTLIHLDKENEKLVVNIIGENSQLIQKSFPISENYFSKVKKILQERFHY